MPTMPAVSCNQRFDKSEVRGSEETRLSWPSQISFMKNEDIGCVAARQRGKTDARLNLMGLALMPAKPIAPAVAEQRCQRLVQRLMRMTAAARAYEPPPGATSNCRSRRRRRVS